MKTKSSGAGAMFMKRALEAEPELCHLYNQLCSPGIITQVSNKK